MAVKWRYYQRMRGPMLDVPDDVFRVGDGFEVERWDLRKLQWIDVPDQRDFVLRMVENGDMALDEITADAANVATGIVV